MPDFVRIATLNGLQEVYIVRPLLQAEDITFYIKNELMIQTNPLYSMGTGGLDVMVAAPQAERAYDILKEAGYIVEDVSQNETDISGYWQSILEEVNNLKVFKRFGVFKTLAAVGIVVIAVVVYWVYSSQKTAEDLYNTSWYVESMYDGEGHKLKVQTDRRNDFIIIESYNRLDEIVYFNGGYDITLPGLNSPYARGTYSIDGVSTITITGCDTLGEMYNGTYDVNFFKDGAEVILSKDNLEINLVNSPY